MPSPGSRGGNVRIGITIDPDKARQGGREVEKTVDRVTSHVGTKLTGLAKKAAAFGAGLLTISAAKTAVGVTQDLAKATLVLHKNLGLSVAESSKWAAVAKTRGIESKQLAQAFGTVAKNAAAATRGADKQAEAFKRLGLTQKDLKSGDFNALLAKIADGFERLPPGAEKSALAMQLFGRGWQTVFPLLRDGSAAMREQLELAQKYGVTFQGKTVESVKELIAAQREAKFATMGLQLAVGTHLAPALAKVIGTAARFVGEMRSGEGAGGKFATRLKDIARDAKPIVDGLVNAAQAAAKFVDQNPGLIKATAAIAGIGLALKTLRFGSKVLGFTDLVKAAGVAGTGIKSVLRRAGRDAGEATAASAASRLNTRLPGAIRALSWAAPAVALGAALTAGLRELGVIQSVAQWLADGITGTSQAKIRAQMQATSDRSLRGARRLRGQVDGRVPYIKPDGSTGYIDSGPPRRVQIGPRRASGGRVPGPRVAADSVPALLSPQEFVVTGGGERILERLTFPGVLDWLAGVQPRHFADGGRAATAARAARAAGFRGDALITAIAVAGAESGFNPRAQNLKHPDHSIGLWQINQLAHRGRFGSDAQLMDPYRNARAAYALYRQRGWQPWTTYTSGAYRSWLDEARTATSGSGASPSHADSGRGEERVSRFEMASARADLAIAEAGRTSGTRDDTAALRRKQKVLGARIRKIRRALKGKLRPATRLRLTNELATLIGEHRSLGRDRYELAHPQVEVTNPHATKLNVDLALAQLTPDTADDLGALTGLERMLTGDLSKAQASGDNAAVIELAGELKSVRDSIASLTESIDTSNELANQQLEIANQQLELEKERRAEAQRRANVSESNYATLARAIADIANGQLGGRIGLGFMSPSFAGGGARY